MGHRPQCRSEAGRSGGVAVSATTEVRDITRGTGTAMKALVSGSMVLCGRICRCTGRALAWAWDQANVDAEATNAAQAIADKEAVKKAARPVKTVRRPIQESVAMFGFGAVLVAGGITTAGAVVWPYMQMLTPWRGLITAAGGIAWMVAAWMVSSSAKDDSDGTDAGEDADEDEDDFPDEDETIDEDFDDLEEPDLSPGNRLTRHVLTHMAWLETTHGGKGGLHVLSLIASAEREEILTPGSMTKKSMREWLEDSNFPVDKSTRQPKGVPVLGCEVDYGVKSQKLCAVLGGSATETLARLYGGPVATPLAPAPAAAWDRSKAPAEGGTKPLLPPLQPLPRDHSQGSGPEAV